ncbi:hypothetical protein [Rubinisphaera margarita]|nr:hypothetical protein [Rubinisphaera margarita]
MAAFYRRLRGASSDGFNGAGGVTTYPTINGGKMPPLRFATNI